MSKKHDQAPQPDRDITASAILGIVEYTGGPGAEKRGELASATREVAEALNMGYWRSAQRGLSGLDALPADTVLARMAEIEAGFDLPQLLLAYPAARLSVIVAAASLANGLGARATRDVVRSYALSDQADGEGAEFCCVQLAWMASQGMYPGLLFSGRKSAAVVYSTEPHGYLSIEQALLAPSARLTDRQPTRGVLVVAEAGPVFVADSLDRIWPARLDEVQLNGHFPVAGVAVVDIASGEPAHGEQLPVALLGTSAGRATYVTSKGRQVARKKTLQKTGNDQIR